MTPKSSALLPSALVLTLASEGWGMLSRAPDEGLAVSEGDNSHRKDIQQVIDLSQGVDAGGQFKWRAATPQPSTDSDLRSFVSCRGEYVRGLDLLAAAKASKLAGDDEKEMTLRDGARAAFSSAVKVPGEESEAKALAYAELGSMDLEDEAYSSALAFLRSAFAIEAFKGKEKVVTAIKLADVLMRFGQHVEVVTVLEEALREEECQGALKARVILHQGLVKEQAGPFQLDSALGCCRSALALTDEFGRPVLDQADLLRLYHLQAKLFLMKEEFQLALKAAEEGLAVEVERSVLGGQLQSFVLEAATELEDNGRALRAARELATYPDFNETPAQRVTRAQVHFRAKDFVGVVRVLGEVQRLASLYGAGAAELLADAYVKLNQLPEAIAAYKAAIGVSKRGVDRPPGQFELKLCHVYDQIGSNDAYAAIVEVVSDWSSGLNLAMAAEAYNDLIVLKRKALIICGKGCMMAKMYTKAVAYFEEATDIPKPTSDTEEKATLWLELGRAQCQAKDYAKALKTIQAALAFDNITPVAQARLYRLQGQIYAIQQEHHSAESAYQRALSITVPVMRDVPLDQRDKNTNADTPPREVMNVCVLPGPERAGLYHELGLMRQRQGADIAHTWSAIACYGHALEIPEYVGERAAFTFRLLFEGYSRAGQWDEAKTFVNLPRDRGFPLEDQAHTFILSGQAQVHLGESRQGIKMISDALEKGGMAHFKRCEGCRERMRDALRHAYRKNISGTTGGLQGPVKASLLFDVGRLYLQLDMYQEAQMALEVVVKVVGFPPEEKAHAYHLLGDAYRLWAAETKSQGATDYEARNSAAILSYEQALMREQWAGISRKHTLGNLAYVYLALENPIKAIECGCVALEDNFDDPQCNLSGAMRAMVYHCLGLAYEGREDREAAIEHYEQAARIKAWSGQNLIETLFLLARQYRYIPKCNPPENIGADEAKAEAAYKRVLVTEGRTPADEAKATRKLGSLKRHTGDYDEASAGYREFLSSGQGTARQRAVVGAKLMWNAALRFSLGSSGSSSSPPQQVRKEQSDQ